MHKTATPSRWFSGWRVRPSPADDPADQGTAFGLDMSLGDWQQELPAPPPPSRVGAWRWWPMSTWGRRPEA